MSTGEYLNPYFSDTSCGLRRSFRELESIYIMLFNLRRSRLRMCLWLFSLIWADYIPINVIEQ